MALGASVFSSDSTTQAYQVSDGLPYYHLLQNHLDQRGAKAEVLPLGVGGYGALQELMRFEDDCLPFAPALVVWQFAANDLINNHFGYERYGAKDNNLRRRPY